MHFTSKVLTLTGQASLPSPFSRSFVFEPARHSQDVRDPAGDELQDGHSLGRQRSISLQALRDERFVLFPRQHAPGYYDSLVDICRRAGFDPKPVQESEKLHTILSLVAMGRGVSLMPRCVTAVGRKGVVCRPLRPSIPNTELGLVHNPATRSQLVRSFITLVKETLVK